MRARILGIGSWSGDDRIGWDAVDAVKASGLLRCFPDGSVDACRCASPGDMLALARPAQALILIDAMRSGAPAGTVRRLEPGEALMRGEGVSSHGLGVAECIAVGSALGMLPPVLVVYGIEAPLSVPATQADTVVRAAIPELLRLLGADLAVLAGAEWTGP